LEQSSLIVGSMVARGYVSSPRPIRHPRESLHDEWEPPESLPREASRCPRETGRAAVSSSWTRARHRNLLVEILTREGISGHRERGDGIDLVEGHEYDLICAISGCPVLDGPGFYRELQGGARAARRSFSSPAMR